MPAAVDDFVLRVLSSHRRPSAEAVGMSRSSGLGPPSYDPVVSHRLSSVALAPRDPSVDVADRAAAMGAIGWSAAGLALTGAVELAVALVTGSVGLLGDALHNLSDVSTSLVVWVGFRVSRRAPTGSHPYGYERAEDLAGLTVALVVWASAVLAGWQSWRKLVGGGHTSHLALGAGAALVGVAGNQFVARYKGRVGRRINSVTLLADARHSWLDALSSVGALVGLAAVALGARWADAIAGLVVTGFIVHVGFQVTRDVVGHLMDGVDPSVIDRAADAARQIPEVASVHVRARWLGRSLLIDIDGLLGEDLTLSCAGVVGVEVRAAVLERVPEAADVHWHATLACDSSAALP
jgi:cation diffusion facilitator family transporter